MSSWIVVIFWLACVGGWLANVVKFIGMLDGGVTAMFTALKPKYKSAGKLTEYNKRGEMVQVEYFNVEWVELGPCTGMEDARKRYGGRPVPEEAK